MPVATRRFRLPVLVAALSLSLFAWFGATATASPFLMGLQQPVGNPSSSFAQGVYDRMAAAHAAIARQSVLWSDVAPAERPTGFDATDPGSPGYDWTKVDAFVKSAASRGLEPLLVTYQAPSWAERTGSGGRDPGVYEPSAAAYGAFARALATRYSGSFADPAAPGSTLPRVRYYQAWNEPNFGEYLQANDKNDIFAVYTRLLNAFYKSVKTVDRTNVVVAAGMGPYGFNGHATDVDPQVFIRRMFCLSGRGHGLKKAGRCVAAKPRFDAWAQHPYTLNGDPTTKAASRDGGGLGNLGEIRRMIDRAVALHTVAPIKRKALWVTEFSWYSDPPGHIVDSGGTAVQLGKPLAVQAAYLSETVYRAWHSGVSALVWYTLEDVPLWPGGLYFDSGKSKPALRAFKLPFFVRRNGGVLSAWATLTHGAGARVQIQARRGKTWNTVATATANQDGIVQRRFSGPPGRYRARVISGMLRGTASAPSRVP